MKKALTSLSLILGSIMIASAQVTQINVNTTGVAATSRINDSMIVGLIKSVSNIVSMLVPVSVGVATLAFFWFLIEFVWKGRESSEKQQESIKGMGYSILAIFVMVSIWGIIGLLGNVFGVGQGGNVPIPTVPVV